MQQIIFDIFVGSDVGQSISITIKLQCAVPQTKCIYQVSNLYC